METSKTYCGIILIFGGSSWANGSTPEQAAQRAKDVCKKDWKDFLNDDPNRKFRVRIFDITDYKEWVMSYDEGFVAYKQSSSIDPNEQGIKLKPIQVLEV